jgi:hypothetical protein
MSRKINIELLSNEEKNKIHNDLEIKIEPDAYAFNAIPKYIIPYNICDDNYLYIPFCYGAQYELAKRPDRNIFPSISLEFTGKLRENQQHVVNESIKYLNKDGSVVLSLYCGFGKSICAIYLAHKIKLKVLVLLHRIVLINQWAESIKQFCPNAKIQKLNTKSKKKDCDFYLINAQNVSKLGKDFFKDIGLVLCDELHLIMAETLSNSFQYLSPRYLIGLSATPERYDGLNILIDLYFGKNLIYQKLFRPHTVYIVKTGFKPEIEMTRNGKINWNSIIDQISLNENRNELIIQIAKEFFDRTFLILVKRIEQGEYLVTRFKQEGVNVTSLLGKQQEYDKNARILVGTTGKASCGFSHDKLDGLILGCDIVGYWIQVLGRVLRTETVIPLIFDLVDENGILLKHFKDRKSIYLEHGGTIKNYNEVKKDNNEIKKKDLKGNKIKRLLSNKK